MRLDCESIKSQPPLYSNKKQTKSPEEKEKMDAAAERLIHSVNAVTDLLKANTKLRENIEKVQRELDDSLSGMLNVVSHLVIVEEV